MLYKSLITYDTRKYQNKIVLTSIHRVYQYHVYCVVNQELLNAVISDQVFFLSGKLT
jgi:hypothetical protein